ncbi:D-beta-hydroxybutyrate dehydrogenase [Klebsiella pneumoniae]|nr:D-beta-hydroxybutyrate dehydrogenase [Klebsiella pneumoniae]
MNLHGKTALVTGSTSGIGLGIAKELAQAGAQVILNGFGDSSHARAEVAALGKIPGYHDADLRDVGQIEAMMRYAESTFGGVDIVINNAGIQHVAPVEQFPVDKWNDILAINLSSVFHTTRLALPGMRQRNWGRIINIASVHGLVASKEKSAYVAAKHAVVGLTKTVALETARSGITCNAICPGWVLTPLVQQQIDKRIAEGVDPEQASALHIVHSGIASPEVVDQVMRASLGRRYAMVGPLEAADMTGLATVQDICQHLLPELASGTEMMSLVAEKVARGDTGARSGQGFYLWDEARHQRIQSRREHQLRFALKP